MLHCDYGHFIGYIDSTGIRKLFIMQAELQPWEWPLTTELADCMDVICNVAISASNLI